MSRIATVAIGVFAMAFAITISLTSEKLGHSVVEAATIFYALSVVIVPAYLFAVLFFVGGVIFLHFSKEQPLEKYQGLTQKTSKEKITELNAK